MSESREHFWRKLLLMASEVKAPDHPLTPTVCQCGHGRCHHENGMKTCHCAVEDSTCACQIFIEDDRDDEDEDPEDAPTPSPEELERMLQP